ncbi:MAG: Asp-tRNA(Asn)/Glu-tRNA(Gln) amidotransferase subunit GatB [Coriobacteriia bacterium]|nr:Asp-tRNA(Asn)/Glu-tRNA(Gln) amidotransferase subunit GatB [Coriobacteriia bacterium]
MATDRLAEVLTRYEAVIGLEFHTEITATKTKMFCGCPVAFGGEANSRVCPTCMGLPGALPVPNQECVDWAILAGLAAGCKIAPLSDFTRKNYFYPDMAVNYQLSQYQPPFCYDGRIDIEIIEGADERLDRETAENVTMTEDGYIAAIRVTRLHLEEDTGKMIHIGGTDGRIGGADYSLADFNRSGTGLMELVTEPDIRTPEEARAFARKLRQLWLTLGVSDCNMEEGSMRADGNVSIRPRGATGLGTKTELKNMNSFKALHDGIAFEIVRQADLLDAGGKVVQETRHWEPTEKVTTAMRTKEMAEDYRYFPDPDTAPFDLSAEYVEGIRARLPELPDAKKERFMETYKLSAHDAGLLAADVGLTKFYEEAVQIAGLDHAKSVSNTMLNDLSAHLNATEETLETIKIAPAHIAELVELVDSGEISSKQAKEVFAAMLEAGQMPKVIARERGLKQVSDTGVIEAAVDSVLAAHPDKVEAYRGGKVGLIGFLVGQVMRETQGQANPSLVNEILTQKLK